jgi:peptidyl-dipeptidase A
MTLSHDEGIVMTRYPQSRSATIVASLCVLLAACAPPSPPSEPQAAAGPTAADAAAFLENAERQLAAIVEESARIGWVNETYINFDTDWLVANVGARFTELGVKLAKEATEFDDVDVPPDARRKLELLKQGLTLPAPDRPGAAQELAEITTRLQSTYGVGKIDFEAAWSRRPRPRC